MKAIYRILAGIFAVIFVAGCASTNPVVRSPGANTLPAWMCDGSQVTFEDTEHLFKDYEGLIDEHVAKAELTVPSQEDGYDGEAEWAIMFPEPLINYEGKQLDDIVVIIYGMIEGKDLQVLSDPCEKNWSASSVGNNVVTSRGVSITLGKIKDLGNNALMLTLSVLRKNCQCEEVIHSTSIRDLDYVEDNIGNLSSEKERHNFGLRGKLLTQIIDNVSKQLKKSSNPSASKVKLLNLAVAGDNSAAVKDLDNVCRGTFWTKIGYVIDAIRCFDLLPLKHAGRSHVAKQASKSWRAAHAGDVMILRLLEKSKNDPDQYNTIGTARLKLISS
ncbi:MAG: hypothetical protein OEL83_15920 [Desulforhopalus sp.]|nr:hypothetical protein [Desulforhopalus sp.]